MIVPARGAGPTTVGRGRDYSQLLQRRPAKYFGGRQFVRSRVVSFENAHDPITGTVKHLPYRTEIPRSRACGWASPEVGAAKGVHLPAPPQYGSCTQKEKINGYTVEKSNKFSRRRTAPAKRRNGRFWLFFEV